MNDEFFKYFGQISGWVVGATAAVGAAVGLWKGLAKFAAPVVTAGLKAISTNSNSHINMLKEQREEIALLRSELAASRLREDGYREMATEMKLMKYQLDLASKKIADQSALIAEQSALIKRLTDEIHLLKGKK